ncbi:hypothetical protein [Roseixanthobacter liquoris]|uniref:hypothetical protein n=1 Tax=Roseixanthobacter liquoris TaxID=3119921 RepID=UPI003729D535
MQNSLVQCIPDIDDVECKKWVVLAYWTEGEAAALLLGKSPYKLNAMTIQDFDSEIVSEFRHLRRRIKRKNFSLNQMNPKKIVKWAAKCKIAIPDTLMNNISYNKARIKSPKSNNKSDIAEIKRLTDENRILRSNDGAKFIMSLYKIILGISYDKYGYRYGNRGVARLIADSLILSELKLDENTIRSALDKAYSMIDDENAKDILSRKN